MIAILLCISASIFHIVYFDFNVISNIYFIITMLLITILINYLCFNINEICASEKAFKYRKKGNLKLAPIREKGKKKRYYISSRYDYTFLAGFDDGEANISLPHDNVMFIKKASDEDPRLEIYIGRKVLFGNLMLSVIPYVIKDLRIIAYVDKVN